MIYVLGTIALLVFACIVAGLYLSYSKGSQKTSERPVEEESEKDISEPVWQILESFKLRPKSFRISSYDKDGLRRSCTIEDKDTGLLISFNYLPKVIDWSPDSYDRAVKDYYVVGTCYQFSLIGDESRLLFEHFREYFHERHQRYIAAKQRREEQLEERSRRDWFNKYREINKGV